MAFQMDKQELETWMGQIFPQVAEDFRVERLEGDETDLRLLVSEHHLRPGGTVSGPSMFALADCAMYAAILARLGKVALAVTTNCSIDFMRKPAANTDLIGIARILKMGRALVVGDVLIYSEGDTRPVARASLTYSIPPADQQR
ncbi:PaaI family thioesterase [Halocynthiibacter styelae]|uniref:PaaI family thioesterase n=1 Tax=Halocynthiibacter styelae TaxID=2761955 RepID=A0A8J7LKC0_9RHOB|nr:PaaI family thioesterase [Paenihalocynthiibacter styelae]MBI1492279.1 PaaI family thioesterase [Paenihalocynthiibacter styelae]